MERPLPRSGTCIEVWALLPSPFDRAEPEVLKDRVRVHTVSTPSTREYPRSILVSTTRLGMDDTPQRYLPELCFDDELTATEAAIDELDQTFRVSEAHLERLRKIREDYLARLKVLRAEKRRAP